MKRTVVLLLLSAMAMTSGSAAQPPGRRGGRFGFGYGLRTPAPKDFDGAFLFCRIMFRNQGRGDGGGWAVDYPRADTNLPTRLSELTRTPVTFDSEGTPNHVVIRLTDRELFQCPFIMMTEVGGAYFDEEETALLREYLLKGGFLWADDFWGEYAWAVWAGQIGKVLPEYPIKDLPMDHSIFHTMFQVDHVHQIPSINHWFGWGTTSERGPDSAVAHARAVTDQTGRILVFITHNTDFGDAFEREGESRDYFLRFSVDGYAFGINVLLYAMTH